MNRRQFIQRAVSAAVVAALPDWRGMEFVEGAFFRLSAPGFAVNGVYSVAVIDR